MKCPHCDTSLQMTDRQGIEIDYCPSCRGVWLDRGELDKIIERSMREYGAQPQPTGMSRPSAEHRHPDPYRKDKYYKKRKGFLGEIFDVFD